MVFAFAANVAATIHGPGITATAPWTQALVKHLWATKFARVTEHAIVAYVTATNYFMEIIVKRNTESNHLCV